MLHQRQLQARQALCRPPPPPGLRRGAAADGTRNRRRRRGPPQQAAAAPADAADTSGPPAGRPARFTTDPLRIALSRAIPNTLLLEPGAELPSLYGSKHFVNLTNGLEAVPTLTALGLPFSYCRICSTDIEQQNWEALVSGLDANLLVSLALGHSCIVWDLGSRNKQRGAPRALWAGLEFARWCLEMQWLRGGGRSSGSGSNSSGSGGEGADANSSDGEGEGGAGVAERAGPQAYLRGHRVTSTFEAHRRGFAQSTRRRLTYYKRYVPPRPGVGVRLYGVYRATTNDGNHQLYVDLARAYDPPCGAQPGQHQHHQQQQLEEKEVEGQQQQQQQQQMQQQGRQQQQQLDGQQPLSLIERDRAAWQRLADDGWGVFAGGIGHQYYFPALDVLGVERPQSRRGRRQEGHGPDGEDGSGGDGGAEPPAAGAGAEGCKAP